MDVLKDVVLANAEYQKAVNDELLPLSHIMTTHVCTFSEEDMKVTLYPVYGRSYTGGGRCAKLRHDDINDTGSDQKVVDIYESDRKVGEEVVLFSGSEHFTGVIQSRLIEQVEEEYPEMFEDQDEEPNSQNDFNASPVTDDDDQEGLAKNFDPSPDRLTDSNMKMFHDQEVQVDDPLDEDNASIKSGFITGNETMAQGSSNSDKSVNDANDAVNAIENEDVNSEHDEEEGTQGGDWFDNYKVTKDEAVAFTLNSQGTLSDDTIKRLKRFILPKSNPRKLTLFHDDPDREKIFEKFVRERIEYYQRPRSKYSGSNEDKMLYVSEFTIVIMILITDGQFDFATRRFPQLTKWPTVTLDRNKMARKWNVSYTRTVILYSLVEFMYAIERTESTLCTFLTTIQTHVPKKSVQAKFKKIEDKVKTLKPYQIPHDVILKIEVDLNIEAKVDLRKDTVVRGSKKPRKVRN